jgi:hypothetical protein
MRRRSKKSTMIHKGTWASISLNLGMEMIDSML